MEFSGVLVLGLQISEGCNTILWGVYGHQAYLGKLGPSTPNHVQRHTKSNPEFSALHLTLNEVLPECQGTQRVELQVLVLGYLRYQGNLGKFYSSPLIFLKLSKSTILQTLNANISRTAYHRKINELISKSYPIKDFHMKVV